ncbi:MAG: hypothetical protein QXG97_04185 [Nitrososphaerota archaeon]
MEVPTAFTPQQIQEILNRIFPISPTVLPFEYGRVYLEERRWYHVSFKRAFAEVPSVLVSAEVRSGWFSPKRYAVPAVEISIPAVEVPSVSVPEVSVPSVAVAAAPTISVPGVELAQAPEISIPAVAVPKAPSISIPTVSIPTFNVSIPRVDRIDLRPYIRDRFREALGDWGLFNWMRNAIADGPGWVVGTVLNWLWDSMIQPQVDTIQSGIQDAVNVALERVRDGVQVALNRYRDYILTGVNGGLDDARSKVQTALNGLRDNVQSSLNMGLSDARAKTQAALNAYRGNIELSVNAGLRGGRDKVQAAFNDFGGRLQENFIEAARSTNGSLAGFRDSANRSLEALRASAESQINMSAEQLRVSVEDVFNSLIPTLWAMEGLPEGVLMTPTIYRNVTPEGFDILSLGKMTASYLAVGMEMRE